MIGRYLLAIALLTLASSDSVAGLQSAMETALSDLQVAQLPINPNARVLSLGVQGGPFYFWGRLSDLPEGAQFVDPIATTTTEAVYREGPELTYDPTTGDVTLFAPPLLGLPDVFGRRDAIMPTGLTLFFQSGERGDSPGLPHMTVYAYPGYGFSIDARLTPTLNRPEQAFTAYESNDPFFPLPRPYAYSSYRDHLEIEPQLNQGILGFSEFLGVEFEIPGMLASGLEEESFAVIRENPTITTPDGLVLIDLRLNPNLPSVGALVDYGGGSVPIPFPLLDGGYTFLATTTMVPEPMALAYALLACCGFVCRRDRLRR